MKQFVGGGTPLKETAEPEGGFPPLRDKTVAGVPPVEVIVEGEQTVEPFRGSPRGCDRSLVASLKSLPEFSNNFATDADNSFIDNVDVYGEILLN